MFKVKSTRDEFSHLPLRPVDAAQPVRELTVDEALVVAGGTTKTEGQAKSVGSINAG
jgi:hypothetical protein